MQHLFWVTNFLVSNDLLTQNFRRSVHGNAGGYQTPGKCDVTVTDLLTWCEVNSA